MLAKQYPGVIYSQSKVAVYLTCKKWLSTQQFAFLFVIPAHQINKSWR